MTYIRTLRQALEPGAPLHPLTAYPQFILFRHSDKVPYRADNITSPADAHNPDNWCDAEIAMKSAAQHGEDWGVGFVLTENDPLWCLDIDKCLQPDNTWTQLANSLCGMFPGAAIEVSLSGRGLHVWGSGPVPAHGKKNVTHGIELYTEKRFIALTGDRATGSANTQHTSALSGLVSEFFPIETAKSPAHWTDSPCTEWSGPTDDDKLIDRAMRSQSSRAAFGKGASFVDLWTANTEALARAYPDVGGREYDASSADAALTQHLAFWTGKDCDRILRLMKRSALVRDKWEREDYLHRTILGACNRQQEVLSDRAVVQKPTPATPGNIPPSIATPRYWDARDGTDNTLPLSELGNAQRLQDRYGATLKFIPETKSWIVWCDGAWLKSPDGGLVRSFAAELPKQIYSEGTQHLTDGALFAKWARSSQKHQTIAAAVNLLSDMPTMRVPIATIDADPWLVGLDAGRQVIDLKTGSVRAAKPSDLITKALGINSMGFAHKAERWQAFLNQVFRGDAELINWLQRWCGYLLTGSTREQILLFGYGHGANGKSVFAEVLRHLMGNYATPIQPETLTEAKRTAGSASPDLAALVGARMVMATETEDGSALAESLVKSLTAGDAISVRPLYGTPLTLRPIFKLLMLGNHRPRIRGTDLGIWRRIRVVPFTRTFTPEERDPELTAKLKTEAPHIIAWMVQGCLAWQNQGLADVPDAIAKQTEEYRSDMDTLGQWIAECCDAEPGREAPSKDLYASYWGWATGNGLRPCSNQAFGRRLTERGIGERKGTAGKRYRLGLALAIKSN